VGVSGGEEIAMTDASQDGVQVLRALWSAEDRDRSEVDEECGPVTPCRNMKDVSFEGFGTSGSDLKTAWRERLAREGKLGSGSLLDLVDGPVDRGVDRGSGSSSDA
jgi:hypothetical protein